MSFYNILFGVNGAAPILLATIGLRMEDVPRFRDCHLSDGNIAVYTRMGGGNRGHWDFEESDPGPECSCPGCRAQHVLARHEHYLYDEDDDFDCTYATYYFRVPKEYKDAIAVLESGEFKPDERWATKLEEVKTWTPEQIPAGIRELLDQINRAFTSEPTA